MGPLRARAADTEDFRRFVSGHLEGDALFLPNPSPQLPPAGTALALEVLARNTDERILSAQIRIAHVRDAAAGTPGLLVQIVRIEPGCDEELRRALAPCTLPAAPPARRGPVIGIDLGTTFSCVAIVEGRVPRVIASRLGYNTLPSVMMLDEHGLPEVGHAADRRRLVDPERLIYGTKRFIGRPWSEHLERELGPRLTYDVIADSAGMAALQTAGRTLSPIEVGACILADLRRFAESELKQPVSHAVITVPAYFTENQRAAVREAASRAGLGVLRIVNEPTAAALAYGYGKNEQKQVLVYDLGGGTFDVSVVELTGGVYCVQATAGDTFLGGLDFDRLIAQRLAADLADKHPGADLDRVGLERLLEAARDAKHTLSNTQRANVHVPGLRLADGKTVDFATSLVRAELEQLCLPLVERTLQIVDRALADAGLKPADIQDVLLVGGQSRMPLIQQRLQARFGRPPAKRVHPDEVVALGAAILATTFGHEDAPTLVDVLPVTIGVAEPDSRMRPVLRRNLALPATAKVTLRAPPGKPLVVDVYQGESPDVRGNELLGRQVYDVPADGSGNVDLTFVLDTECLLSVRSRIASTGQEREDRLMTMHTADAVLERIGLERVHGRQQAWQADAKELGRLTKHPVPPGAVRSAPRKKSWWGWLTGKR